MKKSLLYLSLSTFTLIVILLTLTSCFHKHTYGSWTVQKDATCIDTGIKVRVCECGQKETETIEATSHTAGNWVTDFEPTCTETGKKHQKCSDCSASIKTETIEATGHTPGKWVTDYAATCTSSGKKHQECAECKKTIETQTISSTGHTWVTDPAVAATCTKTGLTAGKHCSSCGTVHTAQSTTPTTSHNISYGKCTNCGTVTAPEVALAAYIITNGTYSSTTNSYKISKTLNLDGGSVTGYLSYDCDDNKVYFNSFQTLSSGYITTMVEVSYGTSTKDVATLITMSTTDIYASGYIYGNSFSTTSKTIYGFYCDTSSVSSSAKDILASSVSTTLIICDNILDSGNSGVTMKMLGFNNF